MNIKWGNETPTKPGIYLLQTYPGSEVYSARFFQGSEKLVYTIQGPNWLYNSVSDQSLWFGPIPSPGS